MSVITDFAFHEFGMLFILALSEMKRNLKRFKSFILDNQAGQASGSIGSGIDINAVGAYIELVYRGMAVHDDFAELLFIKKKVVADP